MSLLLWLAGATIGPAAGYGGGGGRSGGGGGSDGGEHGGNQVLVRTGQTTTLEIGPPLEPARRRHELELRARSPSYARALEMDGAQRWDEAAVQYQRALAEVASILRVTTDSSIERALVQDVDQIDMERRRSQTLASGGADRARGLRLSDKDRGRLLRLKLMTVRAGLGLVPADLASATLRVLGLALRSSRGAPRPAPGPGRAPTANATATAAIASAPAITAAEATSERDAPGDPEVRLLLCATRAAAGDPRGATLELARVSRSDRLDTRQALALATCAAALGRADDALVSLAIALYRADPAAELTLLRLGQAREIRGDSDWDLLRADVRFQRLFP